MKKGKVRVQYQFSEKLVERLDALAEEMGSTRTGVTMWILQNYFVQKQKMMDKIFENEKFMESVKEILTQMHDVDVSESD